MVRQNRRSTIFVIYSIVIVGVFTINTAVAETSASPLEIIDLTPAVSSTTIDSNGTESTTVVNMEKQSEKLMICAPPLLIHGSVDPVKSEYKIKDVIQILCNSGYELANPQSSLLYCSQDGLWKVFTLGDNVILPLPRCIVKRPCPQLPPLIQGSIHVQGSEGSGLGLEPPRAVYQCWFGLVLEPAESEVRYCIQGKWTGENPQCVRAGCGRPATIAHGYYTSRGMVNHVYPTGSSLKYHCDSGYQLNGPAVFTCSWDKEWTPKVSPSCTPIQQTNIADSARGCPLPPTMSTGEYKILLWRNGNGEPAVGAANSTLVPVYSSAMLFCHDGYILHGSPLISCSSHGWWQPFTLPRCVPANPYAGNGLTDGDVHGSMPWMVSLTSAFTVIFLLSFVWIITRLRINCRKNRTPASPSSATSGGSTGGGTIGCRPSGSAASGGPMLVVPRRRRPFWDWMLTNPALMGGPVHPAQGGRGSADAGGDSGLATPTDQDRVALIAYIGDTQATLPTYEEAVRSSMTTTTSWPMAPPPYESILIDAAPASSNGASDTQNLLQSSDVAIAASPDDSSPVDAANRTNFGQVPVPSSPV